MFLSYSSIPVIKYHDRGNVQKEEIFQAYGSRGIRVQQGGEVTNIMAEAASLVRAHILNQIRKQRVNWSEVVCGF